jgi:S-adenosyl-L-methionine hydrolase (adenosine-forming)
MPTKKKKSKAEQSSFSNAGSVIGLLTDFGLQDHYVSVIKGVILSTNPEVTFIDISHNVQPYHIRQASYLLWSSYQYLPKGTLIVCVVDPGVGSERHVLGVRTQNYSFLAPDNGVLDFVLQKEKIIEHVSITEQSAKRYIRKDISLTFHGRDLFAPLAAHFTLGVKLQQMGAESKPKMSTLPFISSRTEALQVSILHIDQFGNIITNITSEDFVQSSKNIQAISVGRNLVSRWIRFYDEAPENTPSLIVGSNGLIEISVKRGNAAQMLNATLDTPIKIYWR